MTPTALPATPPPQHEAYRTRIQALSMTNTDLERTWEAERSERERLRSEIERLRGDLAEVTVQRDSLQSRVPGLEQIIRDREAEASGERERRVRAEAEATEGRYVFPGVVWDCGLDWQGSNGLKKFTWQ
jgi:septal ring factor EnvC (AmiA/AmiB activator)